MSLPVVSTSSTLCVGPAMDTVELAMLQHRLVARRLGVVQLGGRPTKYSVALAELAYCTLADDRIVAPLNYVAAVLGISRSTLFEWRRKYSDFEWAIFCGKAVQECHLATRLAYGGGNPQGILFSLINLHGWRMNGRRSEDGSSSLREALEAQAAGARRVQWDRATNPSYQ
jgi:hypothetical protein